MPASTAFASTAKQTLNVNATSTSTDKLLEFIDSLPEPEVQRNTFSLRKVTSSKVSLVIKNIRTDCSTGPDQLPAKFIKLVGKHLAVPLTTTINSYIDKCTFPCIWKIARISPIPKVDHPEVEDQLRPVSILPVLSKVFEKLVANQITRFIEREAVLGNRICSFRKGHSTTTFLWESETI